MRLDSPPASSSTAPGSSGDEYRALLTELMKCISQGKAPWSIWVPCPWGLGWSIQCLGESVWSPLASGGGRRRWLLVRLYKTQEGQDYCMEPWDKGPSSGPVGSSCTVDSQCGHMSVTLIPSQSKRKEAGCGSIISFSRAQTRVSCIAGRFFTI